MSAIFRIKSLLERLAVLPSSGISYSGPPVSRCSVIGQDVLSCSSKLYNTPQRANHLHSRPSSAQNLLPSTPLRSGLQQANRTFTDPAWWGENHSLTPECSSQVQTSEIAEILLIRIFTLIRCSHHGEHVNYTWKIFSVLCSADICKTGRPVVHKSSTRPPFPCLFNKYSKFDECF